MSRWLFLLLNELVDRAVTAATVWTCLLDCFECHQIMRNIYCSVPKCQGDFFRWKPTPIQCAEEMHLFWVALRNPPRTVIFSSATHPWATVLQLIYRWSACYSYHAHAANIFEWTCCVWEKWAGAKTWGPARYCRAIVLDPKGSAADVWVPDITATFRGLVQALTKDQQH